jgi:hypothetical protein
MDDCAFDGSHTGAPGLIRWVVEHTVALLHQFNTSVSL